MAEISTETLDNEGISHLVGGEIVDFRFVDVSKSQFANPDLNFTGYGADGYYYTLGVADPTHTPFQAGWASEGGHDEATSERGILDRFPSRIFVITTALEVVILNADDLDVWMRFLHNADGGSTYGSFLGDGSSSVLQAAFIEGFLLVATDLGLRIADFRNDRVFILDSSSSVKSDPAIGIADRNDDGMGEADAYASVTINHQSCLCVDVGIVGAAVDATASGGGIVVAAVGHERGLSGIRLFGPGISSPQAKKHADFEVTGLGDWEAVDDNDGDGYTPYMQPTSSSPPWQDNEVRVGDELFLSPGGISVTVTEVTALQVSVTPELDITDSGIAHVSHRPVPSVSVIAGGRLIFANGQQLVARITDEDWYSGAAVIDPRTGSGSSEIVVLHDEVSQIHRVLASGSSVYVATGKGVFLITDEVFDLAASSDFPSAELIYANSVSSLTPSYEILEGDVGVCVDVAVDPETGNVLISAVEGSDCVVTEINPSIHQAFQFFNQDELGGVVNCIVAYRNTEGPPDDETEVA
jgi:hypothetical protein